jgi:hypothetical protein
VRSFGIFPTFPNNISVQPFKGKPFYRWRCDR